MKYVIAAISFLLPIFSYAQDAVPADAKGPGIESLLAQLAIIFVIFYFLLIRPQSKKLKAQQSLISALKKGDKVVTQSGIFGVVTKAKDGEKTVEIEIAKDVEVTVLRSSVQEILNLVVEKPAAVEKVKKAKNTKA